MSDPDSSRLDYRSGADAAIDEARAVHRSIRTWLILLVVWVVGIGVWVVYLAALGYLAVRLLA